MDTADLRAGMVLLAEGGQAAEVVSIEKRGASSEVYNFEVERAHTYFVCDGVDGGCELVHNADCALRGLLRRAGLPGGKNASGPFRYRPPAGHHPSEPLPRGPRGGYLDRFGNEWVKGPYHGDQSKGFQYEWDVQLTEGGHEHWDKYGATRRKGYVNVSPDGTLSH